MLYSSCRKSKIFGIDLGFLDYNINIICQNQHIIYVVRVDKPEEIQINKLNPANNSSS